MKLDIRIPFWVVLILVGIILIGIYRHMGVIQAHRQTISALDSASTAFDTYRLRNEQKVSQQAAMILRLQDAVAVGLVEQSRIDELRLKEIEVNIRLKEQIEMLKKEAGFVQKPVVVYRDTFMNGIDTSLKYLVVPIDIQYKDKWANIYATIDYPAPLFDTIQFLSVPEITLGWQKQGFLKRPQRTVLVTNENPYVTVIEMQNVVIEKKKKWYQTDVAKIAGGIVGFEILRNILIGK